MDLRKKEERIPNNKNKLEKNSNKLYNYVTILILPSFFFLEQPL